MIRSNIIVILLSAIIATACGTKENNPDGAEYVDLGLSVKWADRNLGAITPESSGGYYAWGEFAPKAKYRPSTHDFYDNATYRYKNIGNDISGTEYDVATKLWGPNWQMPTKEQVEELIKKCEWIPTTKNNVEGFNVIGPSGKSIFIPAAYYMANSNLEPYGSVCYWTSTMNPAENATAYILYYDGNYSNAPSIFILGRSLGAPIRPVRAK